MVELVKITRRVSEKESKDGKAHNFKNYYLRSNGELYAIAPKFEKGKARWYAVMDCLAIDITENKGE